MNRSMTMLLLLILAGIPGPAQESEKTEGARELYYFAIDKKESLPPVHKTAPLKRATVHLGLRYNLVLVDPNTGRGEAVESNRNFKGGDCFAIDIEANHSGYLYVLAQQSSGAWEPLLPSAEMAGEANIIDPGKKVRVPNRYCFEIHNPPGAETLFVALSRDPADFYDLYRGIKRQQQSPESPAVFGAEPVQMASARLVNRAVEEMEARYGTRDIAIRKVDQPIGTDEPRGATYIVNASSRPSSTLTTKIIVQHR